MLNKNHGGNIYFVVTVGVTVRNVTGYPRYRSMFLGTESTLRTDRGRQSPTDRRLSSKELWKRKKLQRLDSTHSQHSKMQSYS